MIRQQYKIVIFCIGKWQLLKKITKVSVRFRSLAFAVSIKLYKTELALAPSGRLENNQFFRPTTTGLIALSTKLLSGFKRPPSR
jgi:hypothetical protein